MSDVDYILNVLSKAKSKDKINSRCNTVSYSIPASAIDMDIEEGIFKENCRQNFPVLAEDKEEHKDELDSIHGENFPKKENYKKVTLLTNYYIPLNEESDTKKENYYYVEVTFE
ncbi:hypothetical protein TEHAB4_15810 [Tetragenococcus halophilus]|uniref:hypothetical protein n=1 Tax=Tetragenococcus halophilus TaxID=51669 RepID=UPI001B6CB354|nr:hypothetical protein [Tetragenococcus halophilus]NRR75733.1 hypothetical protein [Tetragenococcus halophilus]GFK28231.1 hypothetical protein YG2_06650 [Tetragenococcus halophilus]GMG61835.1 hypothetical protein TEHAB4_15810 [Tetragenococcus halophilus]